MSGPAPESAAGALRRALRAVVADAVPWPANAVRLPAGPEALDAAWLSDALCGGLPGARVTAVRCQALHCGTTSHAVLELSLNAAAIASGVPRQVFAKGTPALGQRMMLGLGGLAHGEACFYTHVRPAVEIEAPRGYLAAYEPRTWRSIVLLEDVVSSRGATFWTPSRAVSRAQMEDLLGTVAAWHGRLWENPLLRGWHWLRTPADHVGLIDTLLRFANRIPAGLALAGGVLAPGVLRRRAELGEAMRRSMRAAASGPRTYLHGDLHIANTYLTADNHMGVADWQTGLQGGWAYDVGYLMATALRIEDRRAWERPLLEGYLDALVANGGGRVPFDSAWAAYRRATFYPLFAWLYTLGRWRLQPAFQPETVSLTLLERIAAALDDLDSFAAVGL